MSLISLKRLTLKELWPWIFGLLIVLLTVASVKLVIKRYKINQEIASLKNDSITLRAENRNLTELLEYVNTLSYAEEQARLRFGLAKPGEELYIIPETVAGGSQNLSNSDNITTDGFQPANSKRWWHYFFKP